MLRLHLRLLPLLACALLFSACESVPKLDGAKVGPFYKPANFQGLTSMPEKLRRVVILPISDDGRVQEETLSRLDESLIRAINQSQRFECVPVSREDLHRLTRLRSVRSVDVLPHDFLQRLASSYGADGVLFTDITRFDPYPPLSLGVRCKLVLIQDISMVWSIDESFDASKAPVTNAARHYWIELSPPGTPADLSHTGLQSPSKFASYAFSACFETLPTRK